MTSRLSRAELIERIGRAIVKARGMTWTGANYYASQRKLLNAEAAAALSVVEKHGLPE